MTPQEKYTEETGLSPIVSGNSYGNFTKAYGGWLEHKVNALEIRVLDLNEAFYERNHTPIIDDDM
jgi:hypothetical protein